jgi:hypothetical protein
MTTHNYVVRSQRAGDRDKLEREEQAAEKRRLRIRRALQAAEKHDQ